MDPLVGSHPLRGDEDTRSIAVRRNRRTIKLPSRFSDSSEALPDLSSASAAEITCLLMASQLQEEGRTTQDEVDFGSFDKESFMPRYDQVPITEKDPQSLTEAMLSKFWPEWCAAIHEEVESIRAMGVYVEVDHLPPGRKAVGSRFVLHIKRDENGHVSRFKARLVAQGFTQIPGQDFNHTFAPVARMDSIRSLLSVAAVHDFEIRHLDIKTAFLNGELDEEIYLLKPKILGGGFWLLLKGLYGLRQSGRQWYITMNTMYHEIGLPRSESDWSVHRRITHDYAAAATSVDDILLVTDGQKVSDAITEEIAKRFKITDSGDAKWFLGCRIRRWHDRRLLMIDQEAYVESILRDSHMEDCTTVSTPCIASKPLTQAMCPKTSEDKEKAQKFAYPTLVGKLTYLATCTRPDIAFAVRDLSKYMSNWGIGHIMAAKHLLRYLKGTKHIGIIYGGVADPYPEIKTFADSDWASGENRRSVTGFETTSHSGTIYSRSGVHRTGIRCSSNTLVPIPIPGTWLYSK
jgi:hypothetical protein